MRGWVRKGASRDVFDTGWNFMELAAIEAASTRRAAPGPSRSHRQAFLRADAELALGSGRLGPDG